MPAAPKHPEEERRVAAVRALRVIGTPAEERFDKVTRLAKKALGVPYAAVTIVDGEKHWTKAVEGDDHTLTPRDETYCTWVVVSPERLMVIEDALSDPRVSDNPHAASFRFYAGLKVESQGLPVAVVCIGGPLPRKLLEDEIQVLEDLGGVVTEELHSRQLSETQLAMAEELAVVREKSTTDSLTRAWNRGAIFEIAAREIEAGPLGLLLLDIDFFKKVNDTYGHPAGDEVLRRVADRVRKVLRSTDALGRFGGEEFMIFLPESDPGGMEVLAERIRHAVAAEPFPLPSGVNLNVTVSLGGVLCPVGSSLDAMISMADEGLYESKGNGRNRVTIRTPPSKS